MEFTVRRLPSAGLNPADPVDMLPRGPAETWLVPSGPVNFKGPMKWHQHRRGDMVYIPMVPYLMSSDPVLALAFMVQLGIRCAAELPDHKIVRVHISVGDPVNIVEDGPTAPSMQYYIGVGFVVR